MSEFEYTYSAPEQEEVKRIREKYLPKEENKMEQLRLLDAQVTKKGTVVSLIAGILGALVLGTGMSLCLVWGMLLPGIAVGIFGMIGIVLAYPLYRSVTEKERSRLAPQILKLTEELLK